MSERIQGVEINKRSVSQCERKQSFKVGDPKEVNYAKALLTKDLRIE
jgi:hypothetical protein